MTQGDQFDGITIPAWLRRGGQDGRRFMFYDLLTGKVRRFWPSHYDGMDKDLVQHQERYGTGVVPSWD